MFHIILLTESLQVNNISIKGAIDQIQLCAAPTQKQTSFAAFIFHRSVLTS